MPRLIALGIAYVAALAVLFAALLALPYDAIIAVAYFAVTFVLGFAAADWRAVALPLAVPLAAVPAGMSGDVAPLWVLLLYFPTSVGLLVAAAGVFVGKAHDRADAGTARGSAPSA